MREKGFSVNALKGPNHFLLFLSCVLWILNHLFLLSCDKEEIVHPENSRIIEVHPGEEIQEALDKAKPGDTVFIHPGVYRCEQETEGFIVFKKRHNGIELKGSGETPEEVIIDGNRKSLNVVYFGDGIGEETIITNVTVTGGYAFPEDLFGDQFQPELRGDIPLGDDFYYDGAGIMVYNSCPRIENCVIRENRSDRCGGGISVFSSQERSVFSIERWRKVLAPRKGPLIYGMAY